jgi:hypothetical protein
MSPFDVLDCSKKPFKNLERHNKSLITNANILQRWVRARAKCTVRAVNKKVDAIVNCIFRCQKSTSNRVLLPEYGQFAHPGSGINHPRIKLCGSRSSVSGIFTYASVRECTVPGAAAETASPKRGFTPPWRR